MTRDEWKKIIAAKGLLGLEERATLQEIKQAFRRFAREHHPDVAGDDKEGARQPAMHEIITAYQALLAYCAGYRFPLVPEEADESLEAEEWWMERFGRDPIWSKGE